MFAPIVDLTHDDDDTNSHMSDIPFPSNSSALVTLSQAWARPRAKCSLSATDTKSDRSESLAITAPVTYPQAVLSVLGPQEAVELVTPRAREDLNDQRETARRALLHQHAVSTLARNYEAHNYNVQMQVRQPEHQADARLSQRHWELLSRFSQEANQALENQRDILVEEVTSEVWRRARKRFTFRTQSSSTTLGRRHAATKVKNTQDHIST